MESFYVYLQSDASAHHYSSNRRVNFRNHLARPIEFDSSRYEVALTELSYTYNSPYIKANTELYRILELSTPKTRMVNFSTAKGLVEKNAITIPIDIEVFDWAKANGQHLDMAELHATLTKVDRVKGQKQLIHVTGEVKAKKNITTTEELVSELNRGLEGLDMKHEIYQDPDEGESIRITHDHPHLIFKEKLGYSDAIKAHFKFEEDTDSYLNGVYEQKCPIAQQPINIIAGQVLLSFNYIKGEIEIVPAPTGPEPILLQAFASRDVYTIPELAAFMSTRRDILRVVVRENRAYIEITVPANARIIMNERVQAILGVEIPAHIEANKTVSLGGRENTVFELGSRKIYVYTDIVEDQRVGDQFAPILRITDYTGEPNRIVIKDFNQLHYIKLTKDHIDNIRIYLKTEIGEDLPLTFGTVTCTLHFREKRF